VLWFPPVILATQEAEIRRISAQSQSRQKIRETLISTNKLGIWWDAPVIPAMQETIDKKIKG
jgi:hypothetical protein